MANNRASDLVEAALTEALKEVVGEDAEDGDILSEWVLVAYVANVDPEKGSAYPMLFSNGNLPNHTARGLLHTGLLHINGLADEERDE